MALSILNRLNDKTVKDEKSGCWIWTGGNDGKYGSIRFNKKKEKVHRVSAHLFHNYDLNERILHVLHKLVCPNKKCWNPEHLYIGTDKDNSRDAIESGVLKTRKQGSQKLWRKSR